MYLSLDLLELLLACSELAITSVQILLQVKDTLVEAKPNLLLK